MKHYFKYVLFLLLGLGCLTAEAFTDSEFSSFANELVSKVTDVHDKKMEIALKNVTHAEVVTRSQNIEWDPNYTKHVIQVLKSGVTIYRHMMDPNLVYAVVPDSGLSHGMPAVVELRIKPDKVRLKVYANVHGYIMSQIKS